MIYRPLQLVLGFCALRKWLHAGAARRADLRILLWSKHVDLTQILKCQPPNTFTVENSLYKRTFEDGVQWLYIVYIKVLVYSYPKGLLGIEASGVIKVHNIKGSTLHKRTSEEGLLRIESRGIMAAHS
jgi:hypothetical protein